jgi:hypothetical protein
MKIVNIFLALLLIVTCVQAQETNIGANVQSQSMFRGTLPCPTPVFGGYVEYSRIATSDTNRVITATVAKYAENLLVLKYAYKKCVYLAVTDYYYPYSSNGFEKYASHYVELAGGWTYKNFDLLLAANIRNDTTASPYAQLSYTSGEFNVFVGAAFGQTFFYSTLETGTHFVNIGFKYNKKPLSLTWYTNPTADKNGIIIAYEF